MVPEDQSSEARGRLVYIAVMVLLALLGGAGIWATFAMPPSASRGGSFLTTSLAFAAVGTCAVAWELLKMGKGRHERSGTDK